MDVTDTPRYRRIAFEVTRRAAELLPALPRPLFGHPRFRLLLDQHGNCLSLWPITRLHLAHPAADYLRKPPRYQLAAVATCIDSDGQPHGSLQVLPIALHCVALIHDIQGTARLPSVLATLHGPAPSGAITRHDPAALTTSLDLYAAAA